MERSRSMMINNDKDAKLKKIRNLLLFVLSGILGWIIFQTPISSGITLMCPFSGLFGISTILFSLNDSSTIPHQNPFYELDLDYSKFKSIYFVFIISCFNRSCCNISDFFLGWAVPHVDQKSTI